MDGFNNTCTGYVFCKLGDLPLDSQTDFVRLLGVSVRTL
jgi:hypothetical protein